MSRKSVESAMGALATPLYRLHPSRILVFSKCRKWVQGSIRNLKHSFIDLTQVAFWSGQEAQNEFPVPGVQLK